jgi:crotonobetainyl-CoA:carnitine CoA-transferase CaiB-like acyl-CoA transferase
MTGPLHGLRVFDLSRVLAGPSCTQLLGDLGADVIKIERPGSGDDTRGWGPPFLTGADGEETGESAYFLSTNRNKRSLALDIAQPEGAALARRLVAQCDVLVENFKTGGLKKYGLAYADLADDNPGLIYCSITGFGQTGPFAARPGYDFLIQGMGGIMSVTGQPEGEPMKVGVAIADLMTGMYASSAILAALHHREKTGQGQYIDLALLDTQVAWLANQGLNYLTSGVAPGRLGNEHPNIVPYKVLPCSDGFFILAVGNDRQYQAFCAFAEAPELAEDDRFRNNAGGPLRLDRRDHRPTAARRVGRGPDRRGRALRAGQHHRADFRSSAGDPHDPCRDGRRGLADRQPHQVFRNPGRLSPGAAHAGPAHRGGARRAARPRPNGGGGAARKRDRLAARCAY